MQSNGPPFPLLALRMQLVLHALPPSANRRLDPRQQIEISTADEDTNPKCQLGAIDSHPEDVEFRLENHRYEGKEIASGIDAYEDEAYAPHGTMGIDVPVVTEHTRRKQNGCENGHEGHRPGDMPLSCRLQSEYQGHFDPSHPNAHPYQNDRTLDKAPVPPVIVALAPRQ